MHSDINTFRLTFPMTDQIIDDMFGNNLVANKPRRHSRPKKIPGMLRRACSECYVNYASGADPANWCSKVCPSPHLPVWAKYLNRKYWPAKVISNRQNKLFVFFFGLYIFKEVRVEKCLLFSLTDPNRLFRQPLDWIRGVRDIHQYVQSLGSNYEINQFSSTGRPFFANRIDTHLLQMLQKEHAYARNTISAVASTSSTSKAPAPKRKRTHSQSSPPADDSSGAEDLVIDTDEEHVEVCDDVEDAAVPQQTPPPDLMPKEEHRLAIEQLQTKHTAELKRVKKMIWCTLCTEPAVMICCETNFFCSEECFLLHPHRRDCRKPFMGNHVAVVRNPPSCTIPPKKANEVRLSERGRHTQRIAAAKPRRCDNPSVIFRPKPQWPEEMMDLLMLAESAIAGGNI